MKKILIVLLAAIALPAIQAAEPLTTAVFDFQADSQLAKRGADIATLLNARLSAADHLVLVERQEIDKALGEQEIGLTGTVTPESAAKLGALLGAKVFVTGRVFDNEGKLYLVAKVIGTETSRVYGEMAIAKDKDSFDQAAIELADKISALIAKRADTFVAKAVDPAARLEALKKIVADKKLSTVSVTIPEQHINRQVPDPAVQTEIIRTLKALGFDVIASSETERRADIVIGGEAFSEFGMRRGNLVSCRARVEATVTERATGKLLCTDRETAAATDLSEAVAGKQALENAAAKLMERILPQLVK